MFIMQNSLEWMFIDGNSARTTRTWNINLKNGTLIMIMNNLWHRLFKCLQFLLYCNLVRWCSKYLNIWKLITAIYNLEFFWHFVVNVYSTILLVALVLNFFMINYSFTLLSAISIIIICFYFFWRVLSLINLIIMNGLFTLISRMIFCIAVWKLFIIVIFNRLFIQNHLWAPFRLRVWNLEMNRRFRLFIIKRHLILWHGLISWWLLLFSKSLLI